MSLFILILIALWVYPIIAVVASRFSIRKRILTISLASTAVIIIAMTTGISTISDSVDGFFVSTLYFSWLIVLLFIYSFKNSLVKILSGFFIMGTLVIGYISGSVGLLGVALILNDFNVDRTIYLTEDIVYKQYSLGSAPGDYRGIEVSIVKRPLWLPGMEYEIFDKKYDVIFNYKKSDDVFKDSNPNLFSYDFAVKFNALNNTIILMDSIKKDTIHLK